MKKIYLLIITTLFSFSFNNDNLKENLEKLDGKFYTESDFIRKISDDCYLVNVRVYTTLGQKKLVANEDVLVGTGCGNQRLINSNSPSDCRKGYLPNGDYVTPNQTKNPSCLLDLLEQNKYLYELYLASTKETTSNVKK